MIADCVEGGAIEGDPGAELGVALEVLTECVGREEELFFDDFLGCVAHSKCVRDPNGVAGGNPQ